MRSAIYLTSGYSCWCAENKAGQLTCLLPLRGAEPTAEEIALSDGDAAVLVEATGAPPVENARALGLRELFDLIPGSEYAAVARAVPLAEWRRSSRFCGRCGAAMRRDSEEFAMLCPACGYLVYPRINPVVIVLVKRGGRILLARRASPQFGFFSVIAGFVEAGETLEEAVRREVYEETAVRVKNLRYFESQPWSFPNNLMVGFMAEYESGDVRPDGVEMAEAGWYGPDSLPEIPGKISIARRLIDAWLQNGV